MCFTKLESDDHLVIISVNDSVNDDSEAEMLRRSLSLIDTCWVDSFPIFTHHELNYAFILNLHLAEKRD